jgi:uncharacterized protein YfbU (UPF0304 family)
MATVTLRVDDTIRNRLDTIARGRGTTVSELLRSAIDDLLGESKEWSAKHVPQSLTVVERQMLALQHRILARLVGDDGNLEDGDTAHQFDRAAVLESGFSQEYWVEFARIEPELSKAECGLVMDILDMFTALHLSVSILDEHAIPERLRPLLEFSGFDLNDPLEGSMLAYARYLIGQDKWTTLAEVFSEDNDRGNSHAAFLGSYRRMLEAFTPIWREIIHERRPRADAPRYVLTADELIRVATAAIHPERRDAREH